MMIIAGSCSLESESQAIELAAELKKRGISHIRTAIFKPRTNPDDFQGLGLDALYILDEIRKMGLKTVSEVVDPRDIEKMIDHVDIFQVGTRNMQNFSLLKELGKTRTPVILKRGLTAYMDEWINAARYIENGGNHEVIMCERGIRSFDTFTRNVLDIGAIMYLKKHTNYRVLVDPSHSMGHREYVKKAALSGVLSGADGIIVEVHQDPDRAISDSKQTIGLDQFDELLRDLWKIKELNI